MSGRSFKLASVRGGHFDNGRTEAVRLALDCADSAFKHRDAEGREALTTLPAPLVRLSL